MENQDTEKTALRSYKILEDNFKWESSDTNIIWEDGKEYGRFRCVLNRGDGHGLSMLARFVAPPGKAWKIIGRAPELGEEVYLLKGAYYDTRGRVAVPEGTFMYNAPGAVHGGISTDMTLLLHWCSGKPDEIISVELIDFEVHEE
ncbi:MAG: hypothetical protein AB7E55_14070 [Pigmentiphaga sp.]